MDSTTENHDFDIKALERDPDGGPNLSSFSLDDLLCCIDYIASIFHKSYDTQSECIHPSSSLNDCHKLVLSAPLINGILDSKRHPNLIVSLMPRISMCTRCHRKEWNSAVPDTAELFHPDSVLIGPFTADISLGNSELDVQMFLTSEEKVSFDFGLLISEVPRSVYDQISNVQLILDNSGDPFNCELSEDDKWPTISINFLPSKKKPKQIFLFTKEEYIVRIPRRKNAKQMCTLALKSSLVEHSWVIGATFAKRYKVDFMEVAGEYGAGQYRLQLTEANPPSNR